MKKTLLQNNPNEIGNKIVQEGKKYLSSSNCHPYKFFDMEDLVTLFDMLGSTIYLLARDAANILLRIARSQPDKFEQALGQILKEMVLDSKERKKLVQMLSQKHRHRTMISKAASPAVNYVEKAVELIEGNDHVHVLMFSPNRYFIIVCKPESGLRQLKTNNQDCLVIIPSSYCLKMKLSVAKKALIHYCHLLLNQKQNDWDLPMATPFSPDIKTKSHIASKVSSPTAKNENLSFNVSENPIMEVKPMSKNKRPRDTQEPQEPYEYAIKQEKFDITEKKLLGRYIIEDLNHEEGEGVLLDAGSTNLYIFEEYAKVISETHINLQFYTNNYQILKSWEKSLDPFVRETYVEIIGSQLDRCRQAFFGPATRAMLVPRRVYVSAVVIGFGAINFHVDDGIIFSYHAGEPERQQKRLYFQAPCLKKRYIVGTSRKIGRVVANSFNILDTIYEEEKKQLEFLNTDAPICLVTTAPQPGESKEEERFRNARATFYSKPMQDIMAGLAPKLKFEWIVLDPKTGKRIFDEYDSQDKTTISYKKPNNTQREDESLGTKD